MFFRRILVFLCFMAPLPGSWETIVAKDWTSQPQLEQCRDLANKISVVWNKRQRKTIIIWLLYVNTSSEKNIWREKSSEWVQNLKWIALPDPELDVPTVNSWKHFNYSQIACIYGYSCYLNIMCVCMLMCIYIHIIWHTEEANQACNWNTMKL